MTEVLVPILSESKSKLQLIDSMAFSPQLDEIQAIQMETCYLKVKQTGWLNNWKLTFLIRKILKHLLLDNLPDRCHSTEIFNLQILPTHYFTFPFYQLIRTIPSKIWLSFFSRSIKSQNVEKRNPEKNSWKNPESFKMCY